MSDTHKKDKYENYWIVYYDYSAFWISQEPKCIYVPDSQYSFSKQALCWSLARCVVWFCVLTLECLLFVLVVVTNPSLCVCLQ
jgi:hypothetical protein